MKMLWLLRSGSLAASLTMMLMLGLLSGCSGGGTTPIGEQVEFDPESEDYQDVMERTRQAYEQQGQP